MSPNRSLAYSLSQLALWIAGVVLLFCGDWKAAALAFVAVAWVLTRECAAWKRIAKGRKR